MKQIQKQTYSTPQITNIQLDNEISLTLDSTTPAPGPGEPGYIGRLSPEYFNNDPFKTSVV